jgi:hypothetical protein
LARGLPGYKGEQEKQDRKDGDREMGARLGNSRHHCPPGAVHHQQEDDDGNRHQPYDTE